MKKNILKKIVDQRITIFFIVIATMLWFLNRLNRRFTTEIPIEIEIIEDYNSKVWIENKNIQLIANCEADGRLLTIAKLGLLPKIKIYSSMLKFIPKDKYLHVIEPNSLKHAIQQKISNMTVNYIIDSINEVTVSPLIQKKLPILSDINITCAKQFMIIEKTKLTLDSVGVKAPKIILDTMKYVKTEKFDKYDAKTNVQGLIDLIIPKNVIAENTEIGFVTEIAGFTEVDMNVKIIVKNIPKNKNITIIPNSTLVKVHVPIDKYKTNHNMIAWIDLTKKRKSSLFEVYIDSIPKGAKIIMIEPQFVEPFINSNND